MLVVDARVAGNVTPAAADAVCAATCTILADMVNAAAAVPAMLTTLTPSCADEVFTFEPLICNRLDETVTAAALASTRPEMREFGVEDSQRATSTVRFWMENVP